MPVRLHSSHIDHCLAENLVTFIDLLRREGLPVGTAEMIDAFHTLSLVDLAEREQFKTALQSAVAKNRNDQLVFSRLFDHFFVSQEVYRNREREQAVHKEKHELMMKQGTEDTEFKGEALTLTPEELKQYGTLSADQQDRLRDFIRKTECGVNVESSFRPLLETIVKSHLRYCRNSQSLQDTVAKGAAASGVGVGYASLEENLREMDIQAIKSAEFPAVEVLLRLLSRKLAVRILRRCNRLKSRKIDLRRSMRDNMRFGGNIFNIRYRPKHCIKQQVLLLCDVSASMKKYSAFVLHFMNGLHEAVRGLSCFSFSEDLDNLTPEITGRLDLEYLMNRLIRNSKTWGRGTNLGESLAELMHNHGKYVDKKTIVIVVSDTKTVALDYALRELHMLKERVRKIIWLNPLSEERWSEFRSVTAVAAVVSMLPCSTIGQLEEALTNRLF